MMKPKAEAEKLLAWYDAHARQLPWRISPQDRRAGVKPDPYRVWLSEIMLQQTTVATVKSYFERFTQLWPTVLDLAAAKDGDVMAEWAGLGYYARARNLLKCARVVANDHAGVFPDSYDALIALPGIGPYTASAISAIAFDRPETVVDGNVERVVSRLYRVDTPLPAAKAELTVLARALTSHQRPGDYAQAIMDLGATLCAPKKPNCMACPIAQNCQAGTQGVAKDYPKKTPKKPKPTRKGIAYVGRTKSGAWILERRPEKGLLGGMLGWFGSAWNDAPETTPPYDAAWVKVGTITHVFTHFNLALDVCVAEDAVPPDSAELVEHGAFRPSDLPTVMRKAFDLSQTQADKDTVG